MTQPSVEQEILERLHKLAPSQQGQVLALVRSLAEAAPRGVPGRELLAFAGVIDKKDLEAMRVAVEEGCEGIDHNGW